MRPGDHIQFGSGLRDAEEHPAFPLPGTFDQELQSQGRLACSGCPLDKHDAALRISPVQDTIQARDPGCDSFSEGGLWHSLSPNIDLTKNLLTNTSDLREV
ncbi:hypothetical protein GCM10011415_20520 [Salipiger pallidus]|uniref:Uncharacterized protein n=1 Tax=Salipiger pallidus TaxID=1775170 RepID=A0A8J2ZJM1_9RHOB|nr:hypothetical protein GCM10011415_20520 [Salipiger pallidus]